MFKLPVWQTAAYAYRFTVENLGTIIGLIWIPTIVLAIGAFFSLGNYFDNMALALAQGSAAAAGQAVLPLLGFGLLAVVCVAILAVPVMRQALALRSGGAVAHFAFSADEIRLTGAFLAVVAVIAAIAVGAGLAAGIAIAVATSLAGNTAAAAGGAVVVGGLIAVLVFYVAIRLSFLLIPVVVVEKKIDLGRAWTLSGKNFWRIVAVLLAITIPLLLATSILEWAVIGTSDMQLAGIETGSAQVITQLRLMREHLPALLGISLVLMPFRVGLEVGAMAAAYRALAPSGAGGRGDG